MSGEQRVNQVNRMNHGGCLARLPPIRLNPLALNLNVTRFPCLLCPPYPLRPLCFRLRRL